MVKLEQAVIARLELSGEKFEILVDPKLALLLKKGEKVDFNELLASDSVYKDSNKGTVQSPEALNRAFGTTELEKIAGKIIKSGQVQLTTEQRKDLREQKKREIVELIARNAMNPQTNSPHPPQRIEIALEEAKIHIDEFKQPEEQLGEILKELKKLIPISFEKLKIAVKIPAEYSGKASSLLHRYNVQKEEWQSNGSLVGLIELPAGMRAEFLNELNHLTHGNVETKFLEEKK
ncbi:MAG: ribosome assembly factor SBDS [Candidatus Diapherotrites archaeon]|nr:ribosome assembly factor SBDS [Candidatus Diapherotrites archaeon]